MKQKQVANSPWDECKWEPADASAIQALFRGDATENQQKRAINFIVNEVCALPYLAYDKTSDRNTAFALGKQSVAHRIVMLMRLNINELINAKKT